MFVQDDEEKQGVNDLVESPLDFLRDFFFLDVFFLAWVSFSFGRLFFLWNSFLLLLALDLVFFFFFAFDFVFF